MGRKKATVDELDARAEANGYQRGAHREEDSRRDYNKHEEKTKKNQGATLDHYVIWHYLAIKEDALREGLPVPDQAAVRERVLAQNVKAPDLATVKDFFRFCAATGKGKIVKKITCDSLVAVAEWFFAGFTRVTETQTNEDDRSEVYNWIRKTLSKEGEVVHVKRPKHLFTKRDARRLLRTPWTEDDPIFIPQRYRVQFHYIFLAFCETGARLSAFFTDGLR